MNVCRNDELSEGVELFPDDLNDDASIFLFMEGCPGDRAIHLHQGSDCVVIVGALVPRFLGNLATVGVVIESEAPS